MTTSETIIHLTPQFFGERERVLVEAGSLSASTFMFDSGVCGLRLRNASGQLVMLPFQGQQIWSAEFGGRNLTMKSMFDEPRPTRQYLETYGGFLLHCGMTSMGVPTKEDTHPLHGELPNAPYQKAYLLVGQDDKGPYLALGGVYQHTVAFNHNYIAEPQVRLYAGASLIWVAMTVTNLKQSEMEFMYLAHANFRPVDNGRLVYSAPCTPEHVRVRRSIPAHIQPPSGYAKFLDELARQPEKHNLLSPELPFNPEVVFFIDYLADEEGWAHSLQIHPDGSADYIRHRPDQLDKGIRWISRTGDQDALGLILPATAEPEGYLAEKAKGNIRLLPPQGKFYFELEMGFLPPSEARQMEEKINQILAR
ncbi:MAG: aldose 1-epimerase family protein [Anaerolineae bacterium]